MIPLTKNKTAIIDDIDAEIVLQYSWHALCPNGKWYAYNSQSIPMHQFIVGKQHGKEIHHKNDNGLDNRRSNLEHITHAQNTAIGYRSRRGTSKRGNRWIAQISVERKYIWLGSFPTEEEAHLAYLKARKLHRGF